MTRFKKDESKFSERWFMCRNDKRYELILVTYEHSHEYILYDDYGALCAVPTIKAAEEFVRKAERLIKAGVV